jgi:peptide/nickel transport system permease protein
MLRARPLQKTTAPPQPYSLIRDFVLSPVTRYVAQRLFQAVLVMLVVFTVVFLLERVTGNPAQLALPNYASAAQKQALAKELGLDQPVYVQYTTFIVRSLHGDFGYSFNLQGEVGSGNRGAASVRELVGHAFPYTVELAAVAFVMGSILGVALGTVAALNSGTWVDVLAKGVSFLGQSVPSFWLGIMLVLLFSIRLRVLPAFGSGTPDHLILPAMALAAFPLAATTRLTRAATLDVLRAEHTVFERSKGVAPRVFLGHILRNASLPIVTLTGIQLGDLLGGSVVIETLFAWPGMGQLAVQAVDNRDYAVIQAVVLVESAIFVLMNLAIDFIYGIIDPRIRR